MVMGKKEVVKKGRSECSLLIWLHCHHMVMHIDFYSRRHK